MTRLNQIAEITEDKQLADHAGGGRKLTARFYSDGDEVTVHTCMRNTAEALMAGELDKLKNDEQKRFFVNVIN